MTSPTPRSLGYRMPAEWESQTSVWLSWPTNPVTWPGDLLESVRQTYIEVIAALAPDQTVSLLVDDSGTAEDVAARLRSHGVDASRVRVLEIPTVDTWIRDYGPTFVTRASDRSVAMIDWTFNAWGDKYDDLKADDGVPLAMNRHLALDRFDAAFVLEGGSIEVDGCGTVLTTEQCLLNPNRNPDLDRSAIEIRLGEYLNVTQVLWLGEGIVGDDTDGHVDDVARFVAPGVVLAAWEEDPSDDNHPILQDNLDRLQRFRDARGRPLEVRTLPMPPPVVGPDGRLPASYANFLIANRTVIVPVFGQSDKNRAALDVIQSAFPRHHVVGIESTAMVHGLGAVHCCSQQQPQPSGR